MIVCDGLEGLPEAIEATWPQAVIQTCVIHLIRNTFRLAGRRDWDAMAKDLRPVYTAINEADAKERLVEFHAIWGETYLLDTTPTTGERSQPGQIHRKPDSPAAEVVAA